MAKIASLGVLLVSCSAGFAQVACSGGAHESIPTTDGDSQAKMAELIGSVAVNSQSLDGIGTIGTAYEFGMAGTGGSTGVGVAGSAALPSAGSVDETGGASGGSAGGVGCLGACQVQYYPQCTGTLISTNSVLTSRGCGSLFDQLYYTNESLKFAIGADSTHPKRLIDVVEVEYAPPSIENGLATYPDLAVLHLGESVSGIASFPVAPLSDDLLGQQVAAVGFGDSDRRYASGARRAGALMVRATSGLLYPAIFGSFDAYYTYELEHGYYGYGGGSNAGGGFAQVPDPAAPIPGAGGAGVGSAGASPGVAGATASAGFAGVSAGSGGSNQDDGYRQYLQQQYDSALIAPGEAYLGGTDNDVQPCGIDRGGPILRKLAGQLRVLGVFSHAALGSCDRGAIYAKVTPSTETFIDTAAQWQDPCAAIAVSGSCAGNTATRCSSVAEGKRRIVRFDCGLLDQICVAGGDTSPTCTDP